MNSHSSLVIRSEISSDENEIRVVNLQAFDSAFEANLVDLMRIRDKVVISLVGILDQRVVGYIMFSLVNIDPPYRKYTITGLAPLAVAPEYQNMGIGTALVHSGIHICKDNDFDAIVLIGHPDYYTRFGFVPGNSVGLESEYNSTDAFMALELKPGVFSDINGLVRFAPEFREVGV